VRRFRQHRRVLGLAGLKDFGDAGQTAGDVHRAGRFLGLAGQQVTGFDLFTVADFDTRLGRQVVEVEDLAVGAFDGDTRMAFAFVLDDDELATPPWPPLRSSSRRAVSPSSMSS